VWPALYLSFPTSNNESNNWLGRSLLVAATWSLTFSASVSFQIEADSEKIESRRWDPWGDRGPCKLISVPFPSLQSPRGLQAKGLQPRNSWLGVEDFLPPHPPLDLFLLFLLLLFLLKNFIGNLAFYFRPQSFCWEASHTFVPLYELWCLAGGVAQMRALFPGELQALSSNPRCPYPIVGCLVFNSWSMMILGCECVSVCVFKCMCVFPYEILWTSWIYGLFC
jgi:hypothetical protein